MSSSKVRLINGDKFKMNTLTIIVIVGLIGIFYSGVLLYAGWYFGCLVASWTWYNNSLITKCLGEYLSLYEYWRKYFCVKRSDMIALIKSEMAVNNVNGNAYLEKGQ